ERYNCEHELSEDQNYVGIKRSITAKTCRTQWLTY
ncbi:MAG: hypothetical protein RLZZ574_2046, partial [Cyanobacteriota bacterium]